MSGLRRLAITRRELLAMAAGVTAWTTSHRAPALARDPVAPRKPHLAPGRHPGGIVVAMIGAGVDYTRPEVAWRLARDGEGEAIAYDAIDRDNRPFERSEEALRPPSARAGSDVALAMLDEAQAASLVPVRAAVGEAGSLVAALAFVARTPARLALVIAADGAREAPFAEAADRAPGLLLVAPAGFGSRRRDDRVRAGGSPATAIVVTACSEAGSMLTGVGLGRRVDIAVPIGALRGLAADTAGPVLESYAAARVAGLAARILAVAPDLTGAALRDRVLGFAAPLPDGATQHGWIRDARRIHRLE